MFRQENALTLLIRFNMKTAKLYIVVVFLFSYMGLNCSQYGEKAFNSQEWKNSGADYWNQKNPRIKMIKDLKSNHLFVGMERDSVESLLGEPGKPKQPNLYVYQIGWDGIDPVRFYIQFDGYGKLIKSKVKKR